MGTKLASMTLKSLFGKKETVLYPHEEAKAFSNLKGTVSVDLDSCILCGICQKRCPTHSITVDKTEKTWSIDRLSCVQCELCILECPKNSLSMSVQRPQVCLTKHVDSFSMSAD